MNEFQRKPVFYMSEYTSSDKFGGGFIHSVVVLKACLEALGAKVINKGHAHFVKNEFLFIPKHRVAITSKFAENVTESVLSQYVDKVIIADFSHMGGGNMIYLENSNTMFVGMGDRSAEEKSKVYKLVKLIQKKVDSEMNFVSICPQKPYESFDLEEKAYDLDLYLRVTNKGDVFYRNGLLSTRELESISQTVPSGAKFISLEGEGKVNFCQIGGSILAPNLSTSDKIKIKEAGYTPYTESDFFVGKPLHHKVLTNIKNISPDIEVDGKLRQIKNSGEVEDFKFFDSGRVAGPHCITYNLDAGEIAKNPPTKRGWFF